MTLAAVKEKLHQYIDDAKRGEALDDATLDMLNRRWDDYLSGRSKNFSMEESMERIKLHLAENAKT